MRSWSLLLGMVVLAGGIGRPGPVPAGAAGADTRKGHILEYAGNCDAARYPQNQLQAIFTTDEIVVDGRADPAYAKAPCSAINHFKEWTGPADYGYPSGSEPSGILRALWDGWYFYAFPGTAGRGGE